MRLRSLSVPLGLALVLTAANASAEPGSPAAAATERPRSAAGVEASPSAAPESEARPARRRLSTLERWRGRPYLRAREEEELNARRSRYQLIPVRTELGAVFSQR